MSDRLVGFSPWPGLLQRRKQVREYQKRKFEELQVDQAYTSPESRGGDAWEDDVGMLDTIQEDGESSGTNNLEMSDLDEDPQIADTLINAAVEVVLEDLVAGTVNPERGEGVWTRKRV